MGGTVRSVTGARIHKVLKRDVFGLIEWIKDPEGERSAGFIRRVAKGSRVPGSGLLARFLLARERRALGALGDYPEAPQLVEDQELTSLPDADGRVPKPNEVLTRTFLEGEPLHLATELPRDFFDLLDDVVLALHREGVCHNDLHKEQNILVRPCGRPALIDFQLSSLHPRRGRGFRSRSAEDLRHLQKHRRRYTRDGRGPAGTQMGGTLGEGHGLRRKPLSAAWRRFGKPVYHGITRGLLKTRDGEERRPSSGPWPAWTDPLGPRTEERSR